MSYQLLKQDVLFYQRFLKANELYTDTLDGKWGSLTNKADEDFVNQSTAIANQYGTFDTRSESCIITLVLKAQIEARKFLQVAKDNNKDIRILSGTRTYAEQDVLYSKGRNGIRGPIVTNAKGGQSNHNFGIAWDIGVFDANGNYVTDDSAYRSFSAIVLPKMDTIEWGGNWRTFKDYPHYQLIAASESVTAVRKLFESGNKYI